MEHGSVLASRTVLQDRDAGAETEVRGGRARTPHWFGRDVWKSADRTRPWRGAAATDGIRHGPRPPLRREGGFDDDQRCAGTDLGHRAIARAGWREIHFRWAECVEGKGGRPDRVCPGAVGESSLRVG